MRAASLLVTAVILWISANYRSLLHSLTVMSEMIEDILNRVRQEAVWKSKVDIVEED